MPEQDSFHLLAPDEIGQFKCRSPVLAKILGYWDRKRGERRCPGRADIDPTEIKPLLPHVMLVDIEQPFRVRYRLVGTEITRVARFDFTGRYLDELTFESGDETDWVGFYRQIIDNGQPGFGIVHWKAEGAAHRWIEFLICPLSSDGQRIDKCLSAEAYEPLNPLEFDSIGAAQPTR